MRNFQKPVRIFLVQKRWWSAALCLCLAAAIFYVVNYPAAVGAAASTRQLPIYCVQRDQKLVSISFDAAWGDVILRHGKPFCRYPFLILEKVVPGAGLVI